MYQFVSLLECTRGSGALQPIGLQTALGRLPAQAVGGRHQAALAERPLGRPAAGPEGEELQRSDFLVEAEHELRGIESLRSVRGRYRRGRGQRGRASGLGREHVLGEPGAETLPRVEKTLRAAEERLV